MLFNNLVLKLHSILYALSAYNGNPLHSKCTISLTCIHPGTNRTRQVEFHVVDNRHHYLVCNHALSLIWLRSHMPSKAINMTKASVLKDYLQAFKGLGSIPGECSIHLKPDAIPVVHLPRKILVALKDRCKPSLTVWRKWGYFRKYTSRPTGSVRWYLPGKLRVCLDPHDLNKMFSVHITLSRPFMMFYPN